ncbi:MAG: hypothetical protein DMG13_05865 [Acidobacteria bacterium]|nr:MAG: hypothetical protein DMG13_05865 [Acidobacteriota bacterium]
MGRGPPQGGAAGKDTAIRGPGRGVSDITVNTSTKLVPDGLAEMIEAGVSAREDRIVKVRSLAREKSPFACLFPAEVVTANFEHGEKRQFFLKHLGPEEADHPEKQCRDREPRVYRDFFQAPELPVPAYYASRWNNDSGRIEVLLEHIDDWNLKYHELEHWYTAARCLADLHLHFYHHRDRLLSCDFLLRFDGIYLQDWADRAQAAVQEHAPALAARLGKITRRYEKVSRTLAAQPATLVHNDLSPKNVIARRSTTPARICFVDWEMCGVGCGLLDLVHLKYGLEPAAGERMVAAYFNPLEGTPLAPREGGPRRKTLAACELAKTVYRLAYCEVWQLPLERVTEWVTQSEEWFSEI